MTQLCGSDKINSGILQRNWRNMTTLHGHFPTVPLYVCLFCCFTSQVNSYGHCGMVSSPNHTFFLGKPEQAVNQYFVHILFACN